MLKLYVKSCDVIGGLRTDKAGVVSLEYVIVAASIVATVVPLSAPPLPALSGRRLRARSPPSPPLWPATAG